MFVRIILRQANTTEWSSANPVLAAGEFGYEQDTQLLKVGNGGTPWNSLPYIQALSHIPFSAFTARGQIITGSASGNYEILSIGSQGQILVKSGASLIYVTPRFGDFKDSGWEFDIAPNLFYNIAPGNQLLGLRDDLWQPLNFDTALATATTFIRDIILSGPGKAGYFSSGGFFSLAVYKYSFATDVVSTTTSSPVFMVDHAGFANPAVAGYFSRGGNTSAVYKWSFPSDAVTSTTSAPFGMRYHAGFADPAVAGYFSAGNLFFNVNKWAFPSDTFSQTTNALAGLDSHGGFANPAVAGYFNRGDNKREVYKWAFPSDTVTSSTSSPQDMRANAGFSNPYVAGYFSSGDYDVNVYKWIFPVDTMSVATSGLNSMHRHAGFANPAVAGYFNIGVPFLSFVNSSDVLKWSFPTDTVSYTTPVSDYLYGMGQNAGFANA
jgi:hypothetical protein